ncbi:hypothetical protein [Candidatus Mycoplasma haematominutum]|uniref:Uncharacterized protein n=1 Tax=Candidatus Mycoplasma haematominutum 'Birmingham 1' TaxID=1116213 RepID=G8C2Z2_9MOLU|nr:hypothetical protein [Candidatus Mycoplasma haematominutum]CCE66690.1 hypothetical protein (homolog to MSU_0303) [Candidatus Mycoplasma haematominutum 'Birmingham 1']
MFYLNKNGLKGYTVVNYLQTEKFREQIKPQIMKLINKKWIHKSSILPIFELKTKITESLNNKLDKDSIQKVNENCSYLGKWSEFFLENLINYCQDKKIKQWDQLDLRKNWKLVKKTTEESKKYFSHRVQKNMYLDWLLNLIEGGSSTVSSKYAFFLEQENFKNHKYSHIFLKIMDHFKAFLPHCKSYISWNKFTKLYTIKPSKDCKNECEVTGWEFDFFNSEDQHIVDFKFQKKSWDANWVWQLLLYVYLLDFYYGIQAKGITLINTFSGEKWSITLEELFEKNKTNYFFQLLKLEISDYEKIRFMNRILSCFKEWTEESKLEEIIANNFFCKTSDGQVDKYKSFIKKLNVQRQEVNFLSNIHSPKWVWEEWINFSN